MKVVILIVALLAALSTAQLSQSEKDLFVTLHNNARATASPVPSAPLQAITWDETIAADTQRWVNNCTLNYSPNYYATKYGENPVYWQSTTYYDVTSAFNYWFAQGKGYSFVDNSCRSPYGQCSNFKQIVSANTYAMGCAVQQCRFGSWLVCNYKTFAQYQGRLPYTPAGGATVSPTVRPTSPPTNPTNPPATQSPATSAPTGAPTGSPTNPPTPGTPAPATASPATAAPTASPTRPPTSRPATPAPTARPPTSAPATVKPTTTPGTYPSIDLRGTSQVLGVHNQGQCGSCWAFSTVTIIEGALGRDGRSLPLLSDQNVLDCSKGGSCNGGWPTTALRGMISQGGINSQAAYPYKAAQGTCVYNSAISQGMVKTTGQTKGDFASIYNALATYGPVGIAVNADSVWQRYRSGVISADYTSINHAVTVVGYDQSLDAWIVKNSWGTSWGMSGYLYLDAKHPGGAQVSGAFWAKA